MEIETIEFIKQLLDKMDKNVDKLEVARNENDPRTFNNLKKNSFDIHEEIRKLIK
ncbi:MAG: hypothetical protein PF542_02910 [Nanoarchaeota archaeon]|jgi:hypothetical protein|nr:hypothetical protein [Nanoarchaeota archaeon]